MERNPTHASTVLRHKAISGQVDEITYRASRLLGPVLGPQEISDNPARQNMLGSVTPKSRILWRNLGAERKRMQHKGKQRKSNGKPLKNKGKPLENKGNHWTAKENHWKQMKTNEKQWKTNAAQRKLRKTKENPLKTAIPARIRNQTLGDPKTIKKFWSQAEISRFLNILVGCKVDRGQPPHPIYF